MKVIYNSYIVQIFFPKYILGFTLGSTIRLRNTKHRTPDWVVPHEEVHVKQYEKYGIIGFLWIYLWKERHLSYKEKTFEIEAYEVSDKIKVNDDYSYM